VIAVSGIGNNGAFAATARGLGVDVVQHLGYPDHHAYATRDAQRILAEVRSRRVSYVLTTAKDAPRLTPLLQDVPHLVLHVEMQLLAGRDMLVERLSGLLGPPGEATEATADG